MDTGSKNIGNCRCSNLDTFGSIVTWAVVTSLCHVHHNYQIIDAHLVTLHCCLLVHLQRAYSYIGPIVNPTLSFCLCVSTCSSSKMTGNSYLQDYSLVPRDLVVNAPKAFLFVIQLLPLKLQFLRRDTFNILLPLCQSMI
jgi:hypothetical protein